ncbi:MAG: hypothetical protein IJK24_06955 [Oscillospiraceae bacterium]|nr:hypothetical protein [Oscillospiraceae bacterium]MBQ6160665.1 hypothetical protein [Oscillospiraceae bacterium]
MESLRPTALANRKRLLLWAVLSYCLLLMLSYGFPVSGDDWTFSPERLGSYTVLDPFVRGYEVSLHHYLTTNGRLLGNFLVTFAMFSKVVRELLRCGIILGILFFAFRLSGCRSLAAWLAFFALLIALPSNLAAEAYAWASGFCNYVPPTLLFLLYVSFVRRVFCEDRHRREWQWVVLLFGLGFCSQLFVENFTLGLCVLSCAVFVTDWIRSRRPDPALAAHLWGALVGCAVMFAAPGYQNVGTEGYRSVAASLEELLEVVEANFQRLSLLLTEENDTVILPLCFGGILSCCRALRERPETKRLPAWGCILYFTAFPLVCYGLRTFGRYLFPVDFLANFGFFAAIIVTAIFCVREKSARFLLLVCAGCFLIFIAPLLIVNPVGARNAYFFDVLLLLMAVTLLRQALQGRTELKRLAPALALAALLLLVGNLNIYYRNGKVERLRVQLIEEAMERGDREIYLPDYPYSNYTHGANHTRAMGRYYYYKKPGDIDFTFIPYQLWVQGPEAWQETEAPEDSGTVSETGEEAETEAPETGLELETT